MKTTTIAFAILAFGLLACVARAQESPVMECTRKSQITRAIARDRDLGVPSEKVITVVNKQTDLTADDKARMIGLVTMIYGDHNLTPDQWANEALMTCMKRAR